MALRSLPLLAAALFFTDPWICLDANGALPLEAASPSPFVSGDRLELDMGDAASAVRVVTILQITNWPWVLARCDQPQPCDLWINFAQVRSAKKIAAR